MSSNIIVVVKKSTPFLLYISVVISMADAETSPTIRSLLKSDHATWCADAHAVTRVTLAPSACFKGATVTLGKLVGGGEAADTFEFTPLFLHQVFDEDVLFGYTNATLRVWMRDPDLAVCVTASAKSVLSGEVSVRVPTTEGKAKLVRVGADDVAGKLRAQHVIPQDAPIGAFVAVVGDDAHLRKVSLVWAPAPATTTSTTSTNNNTNDEGRRWKPPGECISHYNRGEDKFAVYAWNPVNAPEYHTRLGTLGLWTIENKSAVDRFDEKWSEFSVYQVNGADDEIIATVGFVLLYRFSNPMREKRPDTLRLAQLVIIPRFQRAGHGEALLEIVYTRACADDRIYELGVEDPCEGMSRLRDAVDIGRAWKQRVFAGVEGWQTWGLPVDDAQNEVSNILALIVEPPSSALSNARTILRCTRGQAQRAYLALLLARLELTTNGASGDDTIARTFRLLCKRILLESDADVRAIEDKDRRKEVLEDRFQEMMSCFFQALARIKKADGGKGFLASKAEAIVAANKWAERKKEALAASGGGD
jgi:hypothetical protein